MFKLKPTTKETLAKDTISALRTQTSYLVIYGLLSFIVLSGIYYAAFAVEKEQSFKLVLVISSVSSALFGVALLGLKYTGQSQAIGHFTQFWLYVISFSVITVVGGGVSSSSIYPLIFFCIATAFCSLGRTAGLLWGMLYIATFFSIAIIEYRGFEFSHLIYTPNFQANKFVMWIFTLILLSILLAIYEWMLVTLSNEHGGNYSSLYRKYDSKNFNSTIINKAIFNNYLQQAITRNDNYHDNLGIFCIDLRINVDALQDDLIMDAHQRATRLTRKTDTLIRVNQYRLVMIVENIASSAGYELILNDLKQHILQPYFIDSFEVPFTPKISSALYPQETQAIIELFDKVGYKKKAA